MRTRIAPETQVAIASGGSAGMVLGYGFRRERVKLFDHTTANQ